MAANAVTKFILALQSLVRQGLSKQAAEQFAKNEFGEISKFLQKRIDDVYKNPKGEGIKSIKIKDEVFDDTVVKLPIDDMGKPFNPNNPLKEYGKKGKGKFTKAEYLIQRLKNTIKANPDDAYVQENFPNFIKEIEANPDLAKNENVFRELGGDLPSNQKITVYDDDTLDFATLKPTKKFQLNKEKFKQDFNVTDDEVERITKLSSDEQQKTLQKYIDKDFKERIELSDYDVTDLEPNAEGGIVGYYTGGMVDVEPSLSDIGHGSDALMARTRLMSPGSQATTSTGLNYLLAEDNDNIRVPFENGGDFKQFQKEKMMQLMQEYQQYLKNRETEKKQRPYMEKRMGTGPGPILEAAEGGRIGFENGGDMQSKIDEMIEHYQRYLKMPGKQKEKIPLKKFAEMFATENFAEGGRIGFSKGKGVDLLRRGFLKTMGAAGAGIAALKTGLLSLGGKKATKEVAKEIITTPNAPGKPEWFDALVTRVIREGDDVTKTMATKDREIVYRKKIDDETDVMVTQDLDEGVTRVDIDDTVRNVTGFDDPPTVSLQVTDEILEEGGARIKPEFKATENDYRNYATDPDGGYETEFIENTVENTKDLTSDLTKVKSFATNKKETMKEFVESKKRKDNVKYANEKTSSYAADRGPDYDPSDYIDDMADDMASGGLAKMLGE